MQSTRNTREPIFPDSGYVIAVMGNLDPPAASRISDFIAAQLSVK
jgi:hypothetical protein